MGKVWEKKNPDSFASALKSVQGPTLYSY